MHFVIICRQVERGQAWGYAGPFSDAEAAEKAALGAISTAGCIDARVMPPAVLHREEGRGGYLFVLDEIRKTWLKVAAIANADA